MQKNAIVVVGHVGRRSAGQSVSTPLALSALAALSQPTRLDIFRLLMLHEPHGLPAGVIAKEIGCAHNTLSTHFAILARAELIQGIRDGRSIVYHASIDGVRALVSFLVKDISDGHPELCDLLVDTATSGCECGLKAKTPKRTK